VIGGQCAGHWIYPDFEAVVKLRAAHRHPRWEAAYNGVFRKSGCRNETVGGVGPRRAGVCYGGTEPGLSSVANGHENQFLELSERMSRFADEVGRPR
jgi:hypothetical protein